MIEKETLFSNVETVNSKQIAMLKKHFPQCFDRDGRFVQDKLTEIIQGQGVDVTTESYSLDWLGKSYARLLANLPPETLLTEDVVHNQEEQNKNSENLFIEGDNIEVLKHMVNAYSEKIKLIYIDPIYNTLSDDFSYQDKRKFTPEQLGELAGINVDEAERILAFTDSGSNSHSAWLTFMYPRLYIARELLSDDGVIFISIDDNEVAQLKLICDEVFGERNFIGQLCWKNATDNNPTRVAIEHEYILAYSKSLSKCMPVWKSQESDAKNALIKIGENLIEKGLTGKELQNEYTNWFRENRSFLGKLDRYRYIDKGGVYTGSQSVHNPGKEGYRYDIIHPVTKKPCKEPLMGYRFPEDTMRSLIKKDLILYGEDHNKIIELKVYAATYEEKLPSNIILDGRLGTYDVRALFPEHKTIFTNPKPVALLKLLFSYVLESDDLILDFFAGSSTTAHAVMQLNAEDEGKRNFIAIQWSEPTKKNSSALAAGYKTIAQISKERIHRAAKKIQEEHPEFEGDLGFKLFNTIPDFRADADAELSLNNKTFFDDAVLSDEQYLALLTTWRVYDGSLLTSPVVDVSLDGYQAHWCDSRLYFIAPNFHSEALATLLKQLDEDESFAPNKIVLYGSNFDSSKQLEINDALKSYANKKSIELDLIVRY